MSHQTKFTFTCDEKGHTHQWGSGDHFIEMPADVVRSLLVKEVNIITGNLEPPQKAKDDGIQTIRTAMFRFQHGGGEDDTSMVLLDESETLNLAMMLVQWLKELSEDE